MPPRKRIVPTPVGEREGVVVPVNEAQKHSILFLVTLRPGMDDEEIARSVGGVSAFEASVALRDMERAGIVLGR